MTILGKYTLRSLLKKKSRTVVTIIGIILSVAMFTSVTTAVSSAMNYLLELAITRDGSWHVSTLAQDVAKTREFVENSEVDTAAVWGDVAYIKLDAVEKKDIPYLHIGGFSGDFPTLLHVEMTEGRLPQNSSEIIVPSDLAQKGVISCGVGAKISKEAGVRREKASGNAIWQDWAYEPENEEFVSRGVRTYTVVGVYKSAGFGYWGTGGTAGYEALTRLDSHVTPAQEMAYATLKKPEKADAFVEKMNKKGYDLNINYTYLEITGYRKSTQRTILNGLEAALMGIIAFGSIALIYNSFSISVNERKREYGLLSSIGATRRQLRWSVLTEAVMVSAIGVPLGLLAGIGGISLTFYLLRDKFALIMNGTEGLTIHMSATLWSVVVAAGAGFVTVLISAWIPTRKALKLNPIEAIRQNTDIVVRPQKIRTSRLTGRLFGLEGTLASKNYKRNRRKYRAVVFSLFISVVLFVSASSFCDYMRTTLNDILDDYKYDLYTFVPVNKPKDIKTLENMYKSISSSSGVTESSLYYTLYDVAIKTSGENLSDLNYQSSTGEEKPEEKSELKKEIVVDNVFMLFMPDGEFEKFLEKYNLPAEECMDAAHPKALLCADTVTYDTQTEKYRHDRLLDKTPDKLKLGIIHWPDEEEEDEEEYEQLSPEEERGIESWQTIEIAQRLEEAPGEIYEEAGRQITLIYPLSAMETFVSKKEATGLDFSSVMSFSAQDPAELEEKIHDVCTLEESVFNAANEAKLNRAAMLIVNTFSYGFFILISLIAMANVFNTISTNVILRRREFAMLRSVGMSRKGFRKMSNYECLLYGIKGLVYGIPVAVGITALIWQAAEMGYERSFYIPWYSIAIAAGSVFVVVFVTMLYATRKISRDNVVDVLKEDN